MASVRWRAGQRGRLAAALPLIMRIVLNATFDGETGGVAGPWFDKQEDFAAARTMAPDLKLLHVVGHELPLNGA